MSGRIFIDSFGGSLGELPRSKRTRLDALRTLADDPRVSCFERGPAWLEGMLYDLQAAGLVIEDKAEPYPWCRFNLTDAGKAAIAAPAPLLD